MQKRKEVRAFVFPMSDETNQLIAQQLSVDECGHDRLTCADGNQRSLWEVGRETLRRLENDKVSLHLSYDTFISKDGELPKFCPVQKLYLELKMSA